MLDTKTMIFVFGSNTAGIHGGGAAKEAYKNKGARWGLSYGHFGQTFAIPTKGHVYDEDGTIPHIGGTLKLDVIEQFITGFVAYAATHPELDFQVTCLGCGLAGLTHQEVAPIFAELHAEALPNLYFDDLWFPWLGMTAKYWGTF